MFPYLPGQSGYNKRLRKLATTITWLTSQLAHLTSVATDDVLVVDSTPVECGRSRETAKRSELAGWAEYGYCASHSRWFWGLRLHLICTLHGLPVGWALTGAKTDERHVATIILAQTPALLHRPITLIGDKNYYSKAFEAELAQAGVRLLRPARKAEKPHTAARFLKPLRQTIESINHTLKSQLDLELSGGRTPAGVCVRVAQRILALTAAIWHNAPNHNPHPPLTNRLRPLTPWNQSSRLHRPPSCVKIAYGVCCRTPYIYRFENYLGSGVSLRLSAIIAQARFDAHFHP